ncbi:MAG: [protein-PII] uridylyltransferase [Betaproteobacteria bacterium]|nr:[protein-PII] uridylyltransferase [Betaproteobacteria bacterium]
MTPAPNPAPWRDALRQGRDALIAAYLEKPKARALLEGLSRLTDRTLAEIWTAHRLPAHTALVAVGGYGRGELYPQSDVDLLILLDDRLPETERERFSPFVTLLWDVGLPIGHSVRNLSECLEEAAQDVTIQTNLLEARLLAGDPALFEDMRAAHRARLDPERFFQAKLQEQRVRHGRHHETALQLEPNLKESPGGLRDVQTLFWLAQVEGLGHTFQSLVRHGVICIRESRAAARDLDLIAHLRIRLHLLARRREERLLYEFQEPMAAAMGVVALGPRRASERLMQRYFRAAQHIRLLNELVLSELRDRLAAPPSPRELEPWPGFRVVGDLLDAPEVLLQRRPDRLFDAFLLLTRIPGLNGCTARLLRALWRAGRRINPAFRRDAANQQRFLELLRQPLGVILALRLMHRLGILGQWIPRFGRITGQMQHDHFHIYPVDEHILMVVRNLRRFAVPDLAHEFPLAHRLMNDFPRQDMLLLAALFHDIAKGRGGDHSKLGEADARRWCRAQKLAHAEADLVAWLVAEHLTLSSVAQRQDLSDPDVITAFAARCGTVERLTALYLLTVADIRGTSPKVWNAWKEKLTRELYLSARRVLEGGAAQPDSVEEKKEQAREQLRLYGFAQGAETVLWRRLDDLYFLRQDSRDIAWQTRRLLPVLGKRPYIVRARLAPVGEGVEVLVYSPDEPALFARICTFFAHLGYSILGARIQTTLDGHALDSFYALDPEAKRVAYRDILNYIEHELERELAAHGPERGTGGGRVARQLKAFPIEPEVNIHPNENGQDYLMSLTAGDRPGLLADVAWEVSGHGVNFVSARINTLGNRAEDVFVLTGETLHQPSARLKLEQAVAGMLKG